MVRVGGMSYTIDVDKPIGSRLSDLMVTRTGKPLEPARDYLVTGWASVNEGTEGPPVWDVVMRHIEKKRVVTASPTSRIRVLQK